MNKRYDYHKSYGLEEQLSKSIERFSDNAEKTGKLKNAIRSIRRTRSKMEKIPDEVLQWFKDTEDEETEDD